jgi:hypothetical protein
MENRKWETEGEKRVEEIQVGRRVTNRETKGARREDPQKGRDARRETGGERERQKQRGK